MNESAADMLRERIWHDEELLWAGRPRQGFERRDDAAWSVPLGAVLLLIGLVLGGGAIYLSFGDPRVQQYVLRDPGPYVGFALLIGGLGAYLAILRDRIDWQTRATAVYGLTSQRVLIYGGWWTPKLSEAPLDALPDTTLIERPDGRTTILFGPPVWLNEEQVGRGGRADYGRFELRDEACEVYRLFRDAQRQVQRKKHTPVEERRGADAPTSALQRLVKASRGEAPA